MFEQGTIDTNLALLRKAQIQTQQTGNMAAKAGRMNMAQIEEAAKEFEAMFLSQMLKPMFEGVKPDPMFGGGKGEEVFQGLMLEEYGKVMADRGGVGIAEFVKAEMIKLQEEAQKEEAQNAGE